MQRGAQGHSRSRAGSLIVRRRHPQTPPEHCRELSLVLTGPHSRPLLTHENEVQDPGQATHSGSGFGGVAWTDRPLPYSQGQSFLTCQGQVTQPEACGCQLMRTWCFPASLQPSTQFRMEDAPGSAPNPWHSRETRWRRTEIKGVETPEVSLRRPKDTP